MFIRNVLRILSQNLNFRPLVYCCRRYWNRKLPQRLGDGTIFRTAFSWLFELGTIGISASRRRWCFWSLAEKIRIAMLHASESVSVDLMVRTWHESYTLPPNMGGNKVLLGSRQLDDAKDSIWVTFNETTVWIIEISVGLLWYVEDLCSEVREVDQWIIPGSAFQIVNTYRKPNFDHSLIKFHRIPNSHKNRAIIHIICILKWNGECIFKTTRINYSIKTNKFSCGLWLCLENLPRIIQ